MSDRIGKQDLVRVKSHSELRAGMTVVDRDCGMHPGTDCVHVLFRKRQAIFDRHDDGTPCAMTGDWESSHMDLVCFCDSVPEGRLYRLRDLDDDDEAKREAECDKDDKRRVGRRQYDEALREMREKELAARKHWK